MLNCGADGWPTASGRHSLAPRISAISAVILLLALNRFLPGSRPSRDSGSWASLVFLRRQDLAAAVGAGLQVDVVRALQLAGVSVFDIAVGPERMVRAAHATAGGGDFSLGDGHGLLRGSRKRSRRLCRKREAITSGASATASQFENPGASAPHARTPMPANASKPIMTSCAQAGAA
jgi:hypothetical protein